ncbi:reverse transcriptase zinc-binding domain-containing protein [Artemisia annua]|uniref:Reverse transcriptase zinc-binding domain-containing protein n=1 Tax=Artemisia annua TaxID=35608 RepID=A0A2U1M3V4_ARTAN|nr:reverse transcriptase zinc-binding domain-containing protein [Artemisia annua]
MLFSKTIWDNLNILCKLDNVSCIWAEIVSGISIRTANNSLWSVIQRLVFGAAVYYIWQERNLRLFQKKFRSEETVFKIIVDIVRHKLLSLKIKPSVESVKAAVIWKIPLMSSNGENNRNQNYDDNGIKPVRLCVNWVCWFCSGTVLWRCNFVFERGEEGRVASCAGHQLVVWELRWLCTTKTDSNFCAGILFWFKRSQMSLMSNETVCGIGTWTTSLCMLSGVVSDALVMLSVGSYLDELCFGFILFYCKRDLS